MKRNNDFHNIGVIIINFMRDDATINCIKTLRQYGKNIKIFLGNQNKQNCEKLREICKKYKIYYYSLPYNCGIGYSRNYLIQKIIDKGAKYIMWGDNDFVYDKNFNLNHAITILNNDKKIGIVGGALWEKGTKKHYERLMYYDKDRHVLCLIPLEYTYPKVKVIDKIKYYDCDLVFNFCIARKTIFQNPKIKWNPNIKVRYEHSWFFIQLQYYSNWKVVYCPSFQAIHRKVVVSGYKNFRMTRGDEEEYAKSLDLKVGFCLGDTGIDFVKGIPINFNRLREESETYKLENISEEKPIEHKKITEPNFYEIFKTFNSILSPYCLLKTTCLDSVRYKELKINKFNIYIGTKLDDNKIQKLKNIGYIYNSNSFKIYNITIHIFPLPIKTKVCEMYAQKINIPYPVIAYLEKLYGNNWKNHGL